MTLDFNKFKNDVDAMTAGGASYIDAVTTWCVSNGLEPEVGADIVKHFPLMLARMQMEAENLGLLS